MSNTNPNAREIATLRALLAECLPHVRSAAQASHLTDGFRPRRNALDELVERVESASNSQSTHEGPVERPVRPVAWLREQRDEYEGYATLAPLMILGHSEVKPHSSLHGATYEPLYDQAALDAAVAAERERWRELTYHLRCCRECAETDVSRCTEGAAMWTRATGEDFGA